MRQELFAGYRIVRCPWCPWSQSLRRRNGAWMVLKKAARLHIEAKHPDHDPKKLRAAEASASEAGPK